MLLAVTPWSAVRDPSPQDLVDIVRTSYPMLREALVELAWPLVDHVAVQVQGNTACMTSAPMLDPLIGFSSPEYSTTLGGLSAFSTQAVAHGAPPW
ncbi:MAG: hypothetical protein ACKPKO_27550, partial [Candidatus Fonsibacter sp.]